MKLTGTDGRTDRRTEKTTYWVRLTLWLKIIKITKFAHFKAYKKCMNLAFCQIVCYLVELYHLAELCHQIVFYLGLSRHDLSWLDLTNAQKNWDPKNLRSKKLGGLQKFGVQKYLGFEKISGQTFGVQQNFGPKKFWSKRFSDPKKNLGKKNGWPSGGLFFLYDAERHVTTTISIKSLTLEGTHSYYVSSGLEGLLAVTTWSFWDFSSIEKLEKHHMLENVKNVSYSDCGETVIWSL